MSHVQPCITNVLADVASCTYRGEHLISCPDPQSCRGCEPRPSTRGEVCERCYDRIDHAIGIAEHLRIKLAGVDHAITSEGGSGVAGPRLPLTAIHLDLDAITRAQAGHTDAGQWVQTEAGAAEAVHFARLVHTADRAHPTIESERKLRRLRCPDCGLLAATWQPPDWYGDDVHITCLSCGWEATHPDAMDIVTAIETRGAA